ncbi:Peroxidase [Rhynchospora pubera]|uniref:Peroxidase n=1 Tax=Rhynchospora pubera TaxID=906938 RepID=A0AAV8DFC6_9POAL|nr:Peroxidase [Rhynchospora pubera]
MKALSLLVLVSFLIAAAAECPFSHGNDGGNGGANAPPKEASPPKHDSSPDYSPPANNNTAPPPPASGTPTAAPGASPALAPAASPAPVPAPASSVNKTNNGTLSPDYYANICPNLESLVQGAVRGMMASSPIAAAATLRLFFHDCFITGCDASLLIQNPNNDDEQHSSENMFLRADGYKTITAAKAAVDADPQCANKVSCADIMALAARDAVALSGGPTWKVELGRYDALGARASDVDLPLTTEDVPALMKRFSAHGLTVDDLVALSGGHTLGATSCVFVNSRIYPTADAFLDPGFASQLQGICPSNLDPNTFVFFDQSVTSFDNNYFLMVQQKKGVLFSDSALYFDSSSKGIVDKFAADQNAFFTQFVSSMVTLGRLGLKNAANGEIRTICTKPN